MCYKQPGPRCARHLSVKIDKIQLQIEQSNASREKERQVLIDKMIKERDRLKFQYYGTRTGQKELDERIAVLSSRNARAASRENLIQLKKDSRDAYEKSLARMKNLTQQLKNV